MRRHRRRGKNQALTEQDTTRKGLGNNQGKQKGRQVLGLSLGDTHASSPSLLLGPQCPLPFSGSDVADGVVFCETASSSGVTTVQQCQLFCRQGLRSAFSPRPLICSLESQRWVTLPPPRACQREYQWGDLFYTLFRLRAIAKETFCHSSTAFPQ